jgi:hypothetical protein
MTPAEYLVILKRNSLSQSWVGDAFGSGAAVGRKWAGGGRSGRKVPKAVAIILRLIDAGKVTAIDAALAAREPPQT